MKDIIETIIKNNNFFNDNAKIEKINIGFTNTIYIVDDMYVIKICTDLENEENFLKEINFYEQNKDNILIPKLYFFYTTKKYVPYYYEIIEKIDGESLYSVWHLLKEEERENIIEKICEAMKLIHSNVGQKYDWYNYINNKFESLYDELKKLNRFSNEEKNIIEKAHTNFFKYLKSEEFVLVHNDLHFDNIFYKDGKIKIIDFERSMYAPKDFELDILYRMIKKPWKFASEETEKYVQLDDYKNIKNYLKKYYADLLNVEFLEERLAIYNMVYNMKHLIIYPNISEIKDEILESANILI